MSKMSSLLKLCSLLLMMSVIAGQQHLMETPDNATTSDTSLRIVSRRKRFINFPKGSSLQLVYCFLTTAYGTPGGLFTVGITLGLAWEIPSNPLSLLRESTAATVAALHRRDRRELYPKIETFLDKYGVDGRACLMRAVCEAREGVKKDMSFMERILHTIFTFPSLENSTEETTSIYDSALSGGRQNCSAHYPTCPTHILDLDLT